MKRLLSVVMAAVLMLAACSVAGPTPTPTGAEPTLAAAGGAPPPSPAPGTLLPIVTVPSPATITPTPEPTEPPPPATPKPTAPPPTFRTFGDGIWEVGSDIKAGTYRLRDTAFECYWARLKGFDGTLDEILANDNVSDAYAVVTIKSTDAGFESDGCDEWSSDLSRVTDSKSAIDFDGTYIVGTDITAGKWKSTGGDSCYWARLSGFIGTLGNILANGLPAGPAIVTIRSTDKGFLTTGCGTWVRT